MKGTAKETVERRETIGVLLHDPALSLREIAKRVGVTPQCIQQIQNQYFPEFRRPRGARPTKPKPERVVPKGFQRKLIQILRTTGETWCYACHQVKCLDDFPPAVRTGKNGLACTGCNAVRTKWHYHNNPNVQQYRDEYRKSHREAIAKAGRKWQRKTMRAEFLEKQYERLEKQSPMLADAVRQGEITFEEVMDRIGYVRQRYGRVRLTTNGFARAILRWLAPKEQKELMELLSEQESLL